MKILVMGGTGKIGYFVLQQLEEAGHEYKFLSRKCPDKFDEKKHIKGDITDYPVVEEAAKGMDAVALLAAYAWDYPPVYSNPPGYAQMWNVNLTGPFNVLEACVKNKVPKLVYASSACAVGFMTWGNSHEIEYFPVDEEHPCRPYSLYGAGKLMIEQLCYMYTKKFGIRTLCMRIGTSWYPPGYADDMTNMFRNNMLKMSNREPMYGMRDQGWYYVGVKDVAQGFRLGLENQKIEHGIYNLGADESGSDLDSLEIIRLYFPGVKVKNPELFLAEKKKPLFDITKARKELGYRPTFRWRDWKKSQ